MQTTTDQLLGVGLRILVKTARRTLPANDAAVALDTRGHPDVATRILERRRHEAGRQSVATVSDRLWPCASERVDARDCGESNRPFAVPTHSSPVWSSIISWIGARFQLSRNIERAPREPLDIELVTTGQPPRARRGPARLCEIVVTYASTEPVLFSEADEATPRQLGHAAGVGADPHVARSVFCDGVNRVVHKTVRCDTHETARRRTRSGCPTSRSTRGDRNPLKGCVPGSAIARSCPDRHASPGIVGKRI